MGWLLKTKVFCMFEKGLIQSAVFYRRHHHHHFEHNHLKGFFLEVLFVELTAVSLAVLALLVASGASEQLTRAVEGC